MKNLVYCVMEGPGYPEGTPSGVFSTLEQAKNYINAQNDGIGYCIYIYSLDKEGYESALNHLGDKLK
jgi:hypothetical protein